MNFTIHVLCPRILSFKFHNFVNFIHEFFHSIFNILQILPSKILIFIYFIIILITKQYKKSLLYIFMHDCNKEK